MRILKIDRMAHSHGDYCGVVELSYDEVVMIYTALGKKKDDKYYNGLFYKWGDFMDMVCYGKITPDRKRKDND